IILNTVAEGGIGIISYQWQKNNGTNWVNLSGENNTSLTINNITENSQYRCLAWGETGNNCDTAISNTAFLIYQDEMGIIIQPDTSYVCDQGNVILSIDIPTGSSPLSHQWQIYNNPNWEDIIGGNSETINISNISGDNIYRCIIDWNSLTQCAQSISNEANIFILDQSEILANSIPSVVQICNEGNFIIECTVDPSIPIQSYQWQHSPNDIDWTNINDEITSIYSTDTLTESAYFRAIVIPGSSTNCFSIVSESTYVEIIPEINQTNITPDQIICRNSSYTLEITTIGGVAPLQYQWQNSTDNVSWNDISGTNNSIFVASNITDQTFFRSIVKSNASGCDSLISSTIEINTENPISIDIQPNNKRICSGGSSSISVSASGGIGNHEYQWQSSTNMTDWVDISGEITNTLNITNAINGIYYYRCIVSDDAINACLSETSSISTVEVVNYPTISINPSMTSICDGGEMYIETINNSGFTANTYQWQQSTDSTNWTNITDEVNSDYTTLALSQHHWYRTEISWDTNHSCNNSYSEISKIYVVDDVQITTQPSPSSNNLCIGDSEQISITTDGGVNVSYQWEVSESLSSWDIITGENSNQFNIPSDISGTFYYRCIVNTNGSGCTSSITSDSVIRIINPSIEITNQPTAQTICNGGTANLSIEHSNGNGNSFSYSWEVSNDGSTNWTEVNTSQNFTTAVLTSTKYYRCIISQTDNSCGSVTSNVAMIEVVPDPNISQQPQAMVSVCQQEFQALSVGISNGTGTISYQWQSSSTSGSGFSNIDTATNATFYPSTADVSTTYYRCVIHISGNGCTSPLTSNESEFIVNGKVFITQQPQSQSICTPYTLNLSVGSTDGNSDTK
ncbi:MAG: hypothetical protein PHQ11_09900, partial [Paludibacter sp.]|nr:hypothetical protein [Paludibacter sp.]